MQTHIMDEKIVHTELSSFSDKILRKGFEAFLSKPDDYKNKYLQCEYNRAFDGYSYLGQKDSINQYDTDMLHSFVISNFADQCEFPKEFAPFFNEEWDLIKAKIRDVELNLIEQIGKPELKEFYETSVGHMVSCNYYPKVSGVSDRANGNTRLSSHKDVSLFTTFPFGIKEGLSYNSDKQLIQLGDRDQIFSFAGYFLEYFTNGEVMATSHQVELPKIDEERFSFAFFSIIKPDAVIPKGKNKIAAAEYYRDYLNLF